MQNKQHSKIIALCLFGLSWVLAYYAYIEHQSYAGQLMYFFTGSFSQLVQQYAIAAAASLAFALFWALK